MTIRVEITAETPAELLSQIASLATAYGVTSATAEPAPVGEPAKGGRRGRPPKDTAGSADAPAQPEAPKTSDADAQLKRDVAGVAQVVEPEAPEDDGLGDDDGLGEAEVITRDDVKAVLLEYKQGNPNDPKCVVTLVNSVAGVPKLADVPDDKLPALMAAAKKALGKK